LIQNNSGKNYYDRYDTVETALGDQGFTTSKPETGSIGEAGNAGIADRDALDDYVRETVRSLWRLACRSGVSQARFAELIQSGMS
jgi:hypothetical protein